MKERPAIIVVAAGRGSRFHSAGPGVPAHKLSQRLGSTTVLGATVGMAVASHLQVVVVTTEPLADMARLHVASRDVVVLPAVGTSSTEPLGMGYSIAAGVAARPDAPGWLVLPGDMPLVQVATLQAVARGLDTQPVAYAQYKGRRGHPVGFGLELYSELAILSGDDGARRLVARYPAQAVEVDDAGVLIDVDTEADLLRARELYEAVGVIAR